MKFRFFMVCLVVFIFFLCFGMQGNLVFASGVTRVQSSRGVGITSPITVTMTNTPANGHVMVAVIGGMGSSQPTVSGVTESGVSWSKQVSKTETQVEYKDVEIWFGVVGSSASLSISISFSGAINYGAVADICEYAGVANSSYLDKTASNNGTGSSTDTGTTSTTSQNYELWIGGAIAQALAQTTPKNGFALLDGSVYHTMSLSFLEKIVSSVGTANSGTSMGGGTGGVLWFLIPPYATMFVWIFCLLILSSILFKVIR